MRINKLRYKILSEPKKIYLDMPTVKIREKLNIAFINPTAEEDMTGIFGKYNKLDKMYKVKYIHSRNNQLQPQTYDRYCYLLDVGEDENGAYIEYAMVYDKLYEPLVRIVYIVAVLAVLGYLYYAYSKNAMSWWSAGVLGIIVSATVLIVLKKPKENAATCKKTEEFLLKLVDEFSNPK